MSSMYIVATINAMRSTFLATCSWHAAETSWEIILNEFFDCERDIYTKDR